MPFTHLYDVNRAPPLPRHKLERARNRLPVIDKRLGYGVLQSQRFIFLALKARVNLG